MNEFIRKILSVLLVAVLFLSLLVACVPSDVEPDAGKQDGPEVNNDLPQDTDIPSQGEEPSDEEPDIPSLPSDGTGEEMTDEPQDEVPDTPVDDPETNGSEPVEGEEPSDEDPDTSADLPVEGETEDVKELPRDKYGLPLPETSLPEESLSLCLALTEEVGYDYFENAVFLGDSVTLGLRNYTTKKRKTNETFLSNAGFIAVGSYSVYEALKTPSDSTIHALYGGTQTQPQDILASMGAETVFICLGLNDVGLFTMKDHLVHYATLILRIQMACPGIKIVIMSTTPLTLEGERKHLYNHKIDQYNKAVIELAKEYNCYYADVASVLKDGEGYLTYELSSDNYCHLEDEAYDMIIEYLLTHATPDAVPSESEIRDTVVEQPAEVEGYEGEMGEW